MSSISITIAYSRMRDFFFNNAPSIKCHHDISYITLAHPKLRASSQKKILLLLVRKVRMDNPLTR